MTKIAGSIDGIVKRVRPCATLRRANRCSTRECLISSWEQQRCGMAVEHRRAKRAEIGVSGGYRQVTRVEVHCNHKCKQAAKCQGIATAIL